MKRQHPTDPNLFWCPKCQGFKAREEFHKNKANKWGITGLCIKCRHKDRKTRQHPTNNNLFFCTQCKTYKELDKFFLISGKAFPRNHCKKCCQIYGKKYHILYKEIIRSRVRRYLETPKGKIKREEYSKKRARDLTDVYICQQIRQATGIRMAITPEIMELKRQQIIMSRILKEFRKWAQSMDLLWCSACRQYKNKTEFSIDQSRYNKRGRCRYCKECDSAKDKFKRKEKNYESNYTDVYGEQRKNEKDYEGRIQV